MVNHGFRLDIVGIADEGVVGHAIEVLEIAEVGPLLAAGAAHPFTEGELRYARATIDPERRLAARLAAKRAASRLLGGGVEPDEIEVVRGPGGPPRLRLSAKAKGRLAGLGADRALVSLTHGRDQAAAAVLLLRGGA
jgi:phosphopantetheinyl transferase (holo-ACP synthase)